MKYLAVLIVALVSLPMAHSGEKKEELTPIMVLRSYLNALKEGKVEAAKKLTASFPTLPINYLDGNTKNFSERLKSGNTLLSVKRNLFKVDEDCAVVFMLDGKKNKRGSVPAYLIKQNGEWKVFLRFTQWNHRYFTLSDDQKNRYKVLEEWFETEYKRIYEEPGKKK